MIYNSYKALKCCDTMFSMQITALHKFYSLKMQRSIESNRKLPKNKTLLKTERIGVYWDVLNKGMTLIILKSSFGR